MFIVQASAVYIIGCLLDHYYFRFMLVLYKKTLNIRAPWKYLARDQLEILFHNIGCRQKFCNVGTKLRMASANLPT